MERTLRKMGNKNYSYVPYVIGMFRLENVDDYIGLQAHISIEVLIVGGAIITKRNLVDAPPTGWGGRKGGGARMLVHEHVSR
jgi:hypothetical protein